MWNGRLKFKTGRGKSLETWNIMGTVTYCNTWGYHELWNTQERGTWKNASQRTHPPLVVVSCGEHIYEAKPKDSAIRS